MLNLQVNETSSQKALEAVINSEADIGRILFMEESYLAIKRIASKNRIIMELLWKIHTYVIFSANHPLADLDELHPDMLKDYTRVCYADVEVDVVPIHGVRRIFSVNERGTLLDILSNCHDCYMWSVANHADVLQAHNLVIKPCINAPMIIEALVYSKDKPRTREFQWIIERLKSLQY